jgi:hypothetical protein
MKVVPRTMNAAKNPGKNKYDGKSLILKIVL